MKRIINSSTKHSGLVLAEVLIILGAVLIGEYAIKIIGMNLSSLLIALPLIFFGLIMRTYFNQSNKKRDEWIK